METDRYNEYDAFAWVYNKHWGSISVSMIPVLEKILLSKLPIKAKILDLCCGVGTVVGELLKKSYDAAGLDGSEKLLEFAKENVPSGEFILSDARHFRINRKFDAVISIFDSLNHIMNIQDMMRVFNSVHRHLKPSGHFLFDLNTETGFLTRWQNQSSSIVESDHVVAVQSSYDVNEKTAEFRATIFRKEDVWIRSDVTLTQKCYSEEAILDELNSAGFQNIKTIDAHTEFDFGPQGHPFFYGQKMPS